MRTFLLPLVEGLTSLTFPAKVKGPGAAAVLLLSAAVSSKGGSGSEISGTDFRPVEMPGAGSRAGAGALAAVEENPGKLGETNEAFALDSVADDEVIFGARTGVGLAAGATGVSSITSKISSLSTVSEANEASSFAAAEFEAEPEGAFAVMNAGAEVCGGG